VIVEDKQGRKLNIHLGPAPDVAEVVKKLKSGTKLDLLVFRTDKMPPEQYVAKTLILGPRFVELRDSELRPYWAGGNLNGQAQARYGFAAGRRGGAGVRGYRGRSGQRSWRQCRWYGRRAGPMGPVGMVGLSKNSLNCWRSYEIMETA